MTMENVTDGFPYSKDELKKICITVDFLILQSCNNIADKCTSDQLEQILGGYNNLKFVLFLVWEYYGFGNVNSVVGLREISPLADLNELYKYTMFKAQLKGDPEGNIENLLNEIEQENPFDYCGRIENSDKVNDKLIKIFRHLLSNIRSGNLAL